MATTSYLNTANMVIEGNEARIMVYRKTARKMYKPRYYDWNQEYNRKGEPYFLKKYKDPHFVELKEELDGGIKMAYAGKPMGKNKRNLNGEYVFEGKMLSRVGRKKLIKWLLSLREVLRQMNIEHRDIAPPNILYNERNGELKLIDFTWAIEGIRNEPEKEDWSAPYPDNKYIEILLNQLK